jgi:hypothetical protein
MKYGVYRVVCAFVCLAAISGVLRAADEKVETLKEAPKGLSPEIAAVLSETGFRVTDKEGVVCDVWLSKSVSLKPEFKSGLRIKYPFQIGELVGVIRLPDTSKPTDFRGQELAAGTYTLRYGLQPDDGNHLGTSETRDFLVGSNPKDDTSAKPIGELSALFKLSAGASGTTHPAIFLLLPPPEKPWDKPGIAHEEDRDLLILQTNVEGKAEAKKLAVPARIVVRGKGEA